MSTRHQDCVAPACLSLPGPWSPAGDPALIATLGMFWGLHSENKWLLCLCWGPGPSTALALIPILEHVLGLHSASKHHRIYTQRSLAANEPQVSSAPWVAHSRLDSPGALPGGTQQAMRGLCGLLFPLTLPEGMSPRSG